MECSRALDNKFMSNLVDLYLELGEDGFNKWFTDHLVMTEDLMEMGYVSAGCLVERLNDSYKWIQLLKDDELI